MMKYCLYVTLDFAKASAFLMKEILKIQPNATFCAFYGATDNVRDAFLSYLPPGFPISEYIPSINEQEFLWPFTGEENKLSFYEDELGFSAVNHCIIADREIGNGYVLGGEYPKSQLMKFCNSESAVRKYLVGMFDFIFDYLSREKPDAIFFPTLERAFDLGFYYAAKTHGIQFRQMTEVRMKDRFVILDKFYELMPEVRRTFELYKRSPKIQGKGRDEASAFLKKFNENPFVPQQNREVIMECLMQKKTLKKWLFLILQVMHPTYRPKGIHEPYPLHDLLNYLKRRWRLKNEYGRSYWERVEDIKLIDYAYFPLHCNPEASSMVCTPMQTNQFAILEALSKSIPASWSLVVKEHVSMMGRRPTGFYKEILSLPKVRLLHPLESSFDLIRGSRLVATITGTAGLEAMFFGKVPLFFGYTFIQDVADGYVRCTDFDKLADAIQTALTIEPVKSLTLELFLAAMFEESFEFATEIVMESFVSYPDDRLEKCIRRLAQAFLQSLAIDSAYMLGHSYD